jgi:histidinol dehydrogenase
MDTVFSIPIWDDQADNLVEKVEGLRRKLGVRGDIVSSRSRAKTIEVFGESLSPNQVVERICEAVRSGGIEALLQYTKQLDHAEVTPQTIRVQQCEIDAAHRAADPEFLQAIRQVRENVLRFQQAILHQDTRIDVSGGGQLIHRYRPLHRVGICVPGGAAAYPSSLLMTALCAEAAGVEQLAVVAPPTKYGTENQDFLATCGELGIGELYRAGGAQAVAALAYGVENLEPVDFICGPGNLFVALAKRYVYGEVAIDSIAGPSELALVADDSIKAEVAAADLVAQAEHAPGSSLMLTTSRALIDRVQYELACLLPRLDRGQEARESLLEYGALVHMSDFESLVSMTNRIAPEHLQIATHDAKEIIDQFHSAGAIFVGSQTPVAIGDYVAGPSHVLPTGGTARFASGLSSNSFLRSTSIIEYDHAAVVKVSAAVAALAQREGLTAHRHSVDIRISGKS